MEFEYDAAKSEANKQKHGINFEEAKSLWLDERGYAYRVELNGEIRYLVVARLSGKYWTAVFTHRESNIRIISVRRSRTKEIALYDNN